MKSEGVEIRVELKNKDQQATARVAKMIEATGGNVWEKGGRKRAYFNDEFNLNVASLVYTQPYDAYIDIVSQEFVCRVNKDAYNSDRNKFSVEDYFELFKQELFKELKYRGLTK